VPSSVQMSGLPRKAAAAMPLGNKAKPSGTRLSEAQDKTIFVPVDLPPVRERLAKGDFSTQPKAADGGDLRPSIETLLHALMPQKYVLHVHAIDPLALLVGANPRAAFAATLASDIAWCLVGYFKPGAVTIMW
jgi:rhamnose utilization protein RhaD (predicted bifunctional aldolase and dehydrogenase)